MKNGSVSLSSLFTFNFFHFKAFDDYVTLHNLSMLLTCIVTLYHYYTMKLLMWYSFHCNNNLIIINAIILYHTADCGVPIVNRNLKLNLISTLEASLLTLTCKNEMSLNFTNKTTLSVTCHSNGSWIPNPADFIQSCSPFSTTVSPTTGTNYFLTIVFNIRPIKSHC